MVLVNMLQLNQDQEVSMYRIDINSRVWILRLAAQKNWQVLQSSNFTYEH